MAQVSSVEVAPIFSGRDQGGIERIAQAVCGVVSNAGSAAPVDGERHYVKACKRAAATRALAELTGEVVYWISVTCKRSTFHRASGWLFRSGHATASSDHDEPATSPSI